MQFRKVYKILKIGLFPNTYQDEDSSLPGENALESSIPQPWETQISYVNI